MRLIVGAVALGAAAVTVALVAVTRDNVSAAAGAPPPLALEVRPRSQLSRAVALYDAGRYDDALRIFTAVETPEARVGAAFCRWPDETLELLAEVDDTPVGRLHVAIATAALGNEQEARRLLTGVEPLGRDSPYAIRAEDLLHPNYVPGIPQFVPAQRRLRPSVEAGIRLLRAGRRVSARRAFAAAVAAAPNDPEVLTAAAVAEFDKDEPANAFSRLGPLARRFPRAQTVRFHLGLLLVWIADAEGARRQFALARALGPNTSLGRDATRFLKQLGPGPP